MTFEVVWSGAKDRRGECKSLTGYTGPSSLLNHLPDRGLTFDELHELQVALGVRGRRSKDSAEYLADCRRWNANAERKRRRA